MGVKDQYLIGAKEYFQVVRLAKVNHQCKRAAWPKDFGILPLWCEFPRIGDVPKILINQGVADDLIIGILQRPKIDFHSLSPFFSAS
ncbi:hypothetical protein A2716_05160 [candidate division WWE3 bacterium RIFCSPHIGHO2_01_FULL_40_23]|uniref:Uncharacterized protein n=1 Tax=candidate division WWE3 bacterium RIFCSPLOWO2_01_FULL_41_18 TaxID=1802625 RepID=A0A1F4VDM3_UNCKA|nr:MAG: hypothetical protein A2716_05160 [candidate division WWE3 bacterium RIFCSPHIGHO2_01_FULL_40_23]OGC55259.1 MAG: hypothetical protein A3A78_04770 [candidate division WWE3 bacterium RIFCSPLOWO2_01_FULL_41_18]